MIWLSILLLALGIAILIKSSSFVIKKSEELVELAGISMMAVGFIVLAVGTSLPELAISIMSSAAGHPNIAVGNVIGANIVDILLVFGISLVLGLSYKKINKSEKKTLKRILVITSVIPLVMIFMGTIGIVFGFFSAIIFFIILPDILEFDKEKNAQEKITDRKPLKRKIVIIFAGLLFVVIAAKMVVDSSVNIADYFGVKESFIGIIII